MPKRDETRASITLPYHPTMAGEPPQAAGDVSTILAERKPLNRYSGRDLSPGGRPRRPGTARATGALPGRQARGPILVHFSIMVARGSSRRHGRLRRLI